MTNIADKNGIVLHGHVKIIDKNTGEVLVNKRG